MKRKMIHVFAVALIFIVAVALMFPSTPPPTTQESTRLSGATRYQTAQAIGEAYSNTKVDAVILASGNDFPDALSASTLSKKLNAPILLVDQSAGASTEAFAYIRAHVPSTTGQIYIVGGSGVIGSDFETALHREGYQNITRLGGQDRFGTNDLVVGKVQAPSGTPVFIASGEDFPDALAASSFAGSNGYPILLVGKETFPDNVAKYLANNKPSKVYIVGGTGVVGASVEAQIRAIVTDVKRLAGADRFETTGAVIHEFALNPQTIYLANAYNFPDALAGSALAAKNSSPILLIDPSGTVPPAISAYLKGLHDGGIRPNVVSLGGTGVVPDIVVKNVENLLDGVAVVDPNDPLKGWVVPQIKSTATNDKDENLRILNRELGFVYQEGTDVAGFNMYGGTTWNTPAMGTIIMKGKNTDPIVDAVFFIYYWGNDVYTPEISRVRPITTQAFKFYFPNDYQKAVSIVDAFASGNDIDSGKVFTLDGRQVKFTDSSKNVTITISVPGQTLN